MREYVITPHAKSEMARRGLEDEMIQLVLAVPDQRVEVRPGRIVLQSKVAMDVPARSYLVGGGRMKVTYDPRTDTLNVTLREDAQVAESDEDKPGIILDYDSDGNLVSLEILDASKRVTDARKVEFQMVS